MPRKYTKKATDSWENKGARIGGSIGAIASKVKNIIQELNVEHKNIDVLVSTAALTTGVVIPIVPVAQGSGPTDRNGNSIKTQSLLLRYGITVNAANCHCRVFLFRDNQQIGDTTPTLGDVLENSDVYSPLDAVTNIGRFSILYDKTHSLVLASDHAQTNIVKVFKKVANHTKFNGTLSTDVQKNGMYLAFISDNASTPNFTARTRVRFVDN